MPALLTGELDDRQAAFAREVVNGVQISQAAGLAGYHPDYGHVLLRHPRIAAAIEHEIARRLTTEAAPLAYCVGISLLRDDTVSPRIRADLLVKMLGMAGHGAKEHVGASDKQLSEMSANELRAYIDRNQAEIIKLEDELVSRARDVSAPHSAPIPATIDAKPLEYLD